MATLKTIFKLFDGYSSTIDKINRKTDQATDKILKASMGTDDLNSKLEATGASANIANTGLSKLVRTFLSLAAVKKGMDFIDGYTNTDARLNLINDNLQTQLELQDKIFAAADRSRGVYSEMAGAVSKMGLLAGNAFTSNDELIAFTELVQKSFKVGGAEISEQQGAMRQLTQAMASGRLQGDEMVSIMENAPLIYQAIEKYMGLSEGELKKLSSEGVISADIIKNAMFMAGEEIERQFSEMPMTFADIWAKIINGGTKAFRTLTSSVNKLINLKGFQTIIDIFIIGINMLANDIEMLVDLIVDNWSVIGPILAAIGGYMLSTIITKLWAMIAPLALQGALWNMITSPIFITVLAIGLVISVLHSMGVTFEDVFGFVGGLVGAFIGYFLNGLINMWNNTAIFVNFLGNVFRNPVASIQILFYDLVVNVLGYIETMAKGIEDIINKIPGVEVDITSGLSNFKNKIKDASKAVKDESEFVEYMQTKTFIDYSDAFTKGSDIGKNVYNGISDTITDFANKFIGTDDGFDFSEFGTTGNPLTVKGKVDVDMSDEDLQYLRDIAERDYVNKFSTATLAPNVNISFGDVHEEADADKVAGRIKKILEEELAVVAEGDY